MIFRGMGHPARTGAPNCGPEEKPIRFARDDRALGTMRSNEKRVRGVSSWNALRLHIWWGFANSALKEAPPAHHDVIVKFRDILQEEWRRECNSRCKAPLNVLCRRPNKRPPQQLDCDAIQHCVLCKAYMKRSPRPPLARCTEMSVTTNTLPSGITKGDCVPSGLVIVGWRWPRISIRLSVASLASIPA